jgi:hypothetical protein
MAAASCSPVVASRRAKFVDEFRVPTPLGAQPRSPRTGARPSVRFCVGLIKMVLYLWMSENAEVESRKLYFCQAARAEIYTKTTNLCVWYVGYFGFSAAELWGCCARMALM